MVMCRPQHLKNYVRDKRAYCEFCGTTCFIMTLWTLLGCKSMAGAGVKMTYVGSMDGLVHC